MSYNFGSNIDLHNNEIQNVVVQRLISTPENPIKGQIYFNTSSDRLFYYNGAQWVGADALGASMTGNNIITSINGATFLIDDERLSQNVRDAIAL